MYFCFAFSCNFWSIGGFKYASRMILSMFFFFNVRNDGGEGVYVYDFFALGVRHWVRNMSDSWHSYKVYLWECMLCISF